VARTKGHLCRSSGTDEHDTRQIIAFYVGDPSHASARQLWANLPAVYREQAMFSTDQYTVYTRMIPAPQHKAITKKAHKTNHIERFHNTLRQRVSRLFRATLAFFKKLVNHIGIIKYFIYHYNLTNAELWPFTLYNKPRQLSAQIMNARFLQHHYFRVNVKK
jgi:IS1 family transposase